MTVFVDTSALYALLDEDDRHHLSAVERWRNLLDHEDLVTTTYVVIETSALVQRRLGHAAAEQLHVGLLPAIDVQPVGVELHQRAVSRWRATGVRGLSLVDVASFELMEAIGAVSAFAYDDDFDAAGFRTLR